MSLESFKYLCHPLFGNLSFLESSSFCLGVCDVPFYLDQSCTYLTVIVSEGLSEASLLEWMLATQQEPSKVYIFFGRISSNYLGPFFSPCDSQQILLLFDPFLLSLFGLSFAIHELFHFLFCNS